MFCADFRCTLAQHIVSISILTLFEIELMLMMFVYRKDFFVGRGSFWLNMDLIVVVSRTICHNLICMVFLGPFLSFVHHLRSV